MGAKYREPSEKVCSECGKLVKRYNAETCSDACALIRKNKTVELLRQVRKMKAERFCRTCKKNYRLADYKAEILAPYTPHQLMQTCPDCQLKEQSAPGYFAATKALMRKSACNLEDMDRATREGKLLYWQARPDHFRSIYRLPATRENILAVQL